MIRRYVGQGLPGRKHIESYFLHPDAIARAAGVTSEEVIEHVRQVFSLDISGRYVAQDEPDAILEANEKLIFQEHQYSILKQYKVSKFDIAQGR